MKLFDNDSTSEHVLMNFIRFPFRVEGRGWVEKGCKQISLTFYNFLTKIRQRTECTLLIVLGTKHAFFVGKGKAVLAEVRAFESHGEDLLQLHSTHNGYTTHPTIREYLSFNPVKAPLNLASILTAL